MSKIQRLRDQLYLLQGSRCFYCDRGIPPDDRSLEHVIPSSDGGLADASNGVVVCEAANQLLGSATPKQKMFMLKAGGGKIECPKKCMPVAGHPDNGVCDPESGPGHTAKAVRGPQAGQGANRGRNPAQTQAPLNGGLAQTQEAQSKTNEQTPMTAKQKNKARSGRQSMPRPASGGRRR